MNAITYTPAQQAELRQLVLGYNSYYDTLIPGEDEGLTFDQIAARAGQRADMVHGYGESLHELLDGVASPTRRNFAMFEARLLRYARMSSKMSPDLRSVTHSHLLALREINPAINIDAPITPGERQEDATAARSEDYGDLCLRCFTHHRGECA